MIANKDEIGGSQAAIDNNAVDPAATSNTSLPESNII
tara:strand:+ start:6172 stop:6282 length:111 start_codon:yes stop_codon:yes gene_type:complete